MVREQNKASVEVVILKKIAKKETQQNKENGGRDIKEKNPKK